MKRHVVLVLRLLAAVTIAPIMIAIVCVIEVVAEWRETA